MKYFLIVISVILFITSNIISANYIGIDAKNPVHFLNPSYIYASPLPDSKMNTSLSAIIVRTRNDLSYSSDYYNLISVSGSMSGIHSGTVRLSDEGHTLIFNPESAFSPGEKVTVDIKDGIIDSSGVELGSANYSFEISSTTISRSAGRNTFAAEINTYSGSTLKINTQSQPSSSSNKNGNQESYNFPADLPKLSVQESANLPEQMIFLSNFPSGTAVTSQPYLLILNNEGLPFYYKKLPGECTDFKLQPNGQMSYYDMSKGLFYLMNSSFNITDSISCKGYATDPHELRILPNGHYLIIGDDDEQVDMSQIVPGGQTNAVVVGIIIQELDQNKNAVFQWRSWDHFNITDTAPDIDLTAAKIDYVHTNAIEEDTDGNLIISNRHLDEITKINRQTGDIIWRMGGKNNQFHFINDNIGFSHQHAVRRIANGDITLFDNGNLHQSVLSSRACEYKVDEINHTAELVWEYPGSPNVYSIAMGYVQRLDNGNTLIGWGAANPSVTEVTPSGAKLLEFNFPENVWSYRALTYDLSKPYYSVFVSNPLFPPDGIHVQTDNVSLVWSRNKLAQSFHLQVAQDSSFRHIVYEDSTLTDTTASIPVSRSVSNYYWRVLSNNNGSSEGGYSAYSGKRSFSTAFLSASGSIDLPSDYELTQNYPNPFNPSTTIMFALPVESFVTLEIFNILGQRISIPVNETRPAGFYSIQFDAKDLPSGIYLYRMHSNNYTKTQKMLLIK